MFIAINNLCDLVQDLPPDADDLAQFFVFDKHKKEDKKMTHQLFDLPQELFAGQ